MVERTHEHICDETEISSGPFLEGPREVLYLVGAQETAAGPSPLWPVRPHWLRSVAAAGVRPVSPGGVSVRIQGVPLGWLLGCGRARDITCVSSTAVLKPGLESQLCRSVRVTSCLRVCICEMGTAVVPARGLVCRPEVAAWSFLLSVN